VTALALSSTVVVVSGPSGVGKGTLCKALLTHYTQLGLYLSVSMTSRTPRPGEVEGQHYYFVSQAEFKAAIAAGQLLEWAIYNGEYYGTPLTGVKSQLDNGYSVLLEIEPQGAFQVKAQFGPQAFLVFIQPPSEAALIARLNARGTNTPADIEQRMAITRAEIAQAPDFDAQVINDDLTQGAYTLASVIAQRLNIDNTLLTCQPVSYGELSAQ
jgi:guanylate kinase